MNKTLLDNQIEVAKYNYNYIIEDIRKTLKLEVSFEIDLNTMSDKLFKGILNYGK